MFNKLPSLPTTRMHSPMSYRCLNHQRPVPGISTEPVQAPIHPPTRRPITRQTPTVFLGSAYAEITLSTAMTTHRALFLFQPGSSSHSAALLRPTVRSGLAPMAPFNLAMWTKRTLPFTRHLPCPT